MTWANTTPDTDGLTVIVPPEPADVGPVPTLGARLGPALRRLWRALGAPARWWARMVLWHMGRLKSADPGQL